MGGGGRGYEHNYEAPPPITGQKRSYPFPGRDGASPDHADGVKFAKLFVGSVPSSITEEDIRPLFEEHGNVLEVALIKDRRTGQQRGCCFIKYTTSEEADRAIRALHNRHTLPGGVGPIQVRYADGERERLGATEYKLFVGSLNKQASEQEVEEIFAPYGRVEDVYLMRDDMRQSRGCGFVKYAHRDMALAAINGLNGIYTMRGCDQPLTVRFAQPKRPRPGDSRGGPAFGGPGLGPSSQTPGARTPPNINEPSGHRVPPSAWKPMNAQDQGPPSSVDNHGSINQMSRSSDVSASLNPVAPVPGLGGHSDGFPASMTPSSLQQQNFNPSFQQFPPMNQQIPTLQNSLLSPPQQLPPHLKREPQLSASYLQAQTSLSQVGPNGPLPGSPFPTSMSGSGQQSTASSATAFLAPSNINVQSQSRPSLPNQPHQAFPPAQMQQFPQLPVQSPSPLAQMLTQQTQNLRASFQSSQQAFSQIQQQLQMMQPNQSGAPHQQSSHPASQQWPKDMMKGPTNSPVATSAEVPPSSSAPVASATSVTATMLASVKCSWTEHTSPDGFKYYYNSVTGESRWVEPEELKMYKQQQQLQIQKPPHQQTQFPTQQYHQALPAHLQPQLQAQPQMQFPQQSSQQNPLPSLIQSSGAPGPQKNTQELSHQQFQIAAYPSNDSARLQQQGLQAAQEWMWKNKQPAAPEELS
ncbi:hypothetical protein SAY87_022458 [Trapa incisa]|uniref:Flowering time control protein FCA n=1 Tax=Trapa incisa TaxID=236973 RepID=A0AAN7K4A7_9MYRT|nr:hypothetical protein SAY87_022458 [Trapa incisa]